MILKKLVEFLDNNNVKHVNITHSTAFTVQHVAVPAHISGKEMAKTVIIRNSEEIRFLLPIFCRCLQTGQ